MGPGATSPPLLAPHPGRFTVVRSISASCSEPVCRPVPPSLSFASSQWGHATLGHLRDLPLCLRVTFLSNGGLGLADVLLGFVLITCFKNSSYLLTVLIIIFWVASNCDYFSCCLPWQGQLSWKIWDQESPFWLFWLLPGLIIRKSFVFSFPDLGTLCFLRRSQGKRIRWKQGSGHYWNRSPSGQFTAMLVQRYREALLLCWAGTLNWLSNDPNLPNLQSNFPMPTQSRHPSHLLWVCRKAPTESQHPDQSCCLPLRIPLPWLQSQWLATHWSIFSILTTSTHSWSHYLFFSLSQPSSPPLFPFTIQLLGSAY